MPRVLVVDDESSNVDMMCAFLARKGYDLRSADGGRTALQAVAEHPPDLVLLDLSMPDMDGFQVLQRLKTDAVTRFIPVVVVTASTERAGRLRAIHLGADDFLTKPVDRAELVVRVRSLLRLKDQVDELERSENVLLALARTVEARDPDLQQHCERMTAFVLQMGQRCGLGADELKALRLGAHLHDIGKIGLPDHVLLKPGRLTYAERALVQTHPIIGEEIVRPLASLQPVLSLIRHHHERLDGSGYPDRLGHHEVSMSVRILSVADVFDALVTRRPYRQALTAQEALAILREEAERGYWDRAVVECLAGMAAEGLLCDDRAGA